MHLSKIFQADRNQDVPNFGFEFPQKNSGLSKSEGVKIMVLPQFSRGGCKVSIEIFSEFIRYQQGGPLPVINGVTTPLIGVITPVTHL